MRYFWSRITKPVKALLMFTLIFGAAFLVLLYYLGYYDFSFLDSYKDQLDMLRAGENLPQSQDPFASLTQSLSQSRLQDADQPPVQGTADIQGNVPAEEGSDAPVGQAAPSAAEKGPPTNLRLVYSADDLPDSRVRIPTVSELVGEGRSAASADTVYNPAKNVLGKMTFDFQLPEVYTETWRHATSYTLKPVDPANEDSELVAKPVVYLQERPKVDLYMGYILIENGEKTVVVSPEGEPLCSFTTGRYEPAFTRDREDRPLFCRERNNGTLLYFHISEDGKKFVHSDYDPERDGRGLNFDYPPSYGHTDTDTVYVEQDPETGLFGYRIPVEYLPEPEPESEDGSEDGDAEPADGSAEAEPEAPAEESAEDTSGKDGKSEKDDKDKDGKDEKDDKDGKDGGAEEESGEEAEEEAPAEREPGFLTPYQFRSATPFSDGMAVVTAGEPTSTYYYVNSDDGNGGPLFPYKEWSETQSKWIIFGTEDGGFVNNSGIDRTVMYFIGEDGEPLFPTGVLYKNEQDRRVFSCYQPPYTKGVESIGSYYFDHGLIRVRKQIIDFWRYFLRLSYTGSQIKVMDEYDTLIRADGTEFELPVGFRLEGYSEGRLLLSRDGKYGVQSVTGEWIAQPIFADGGPFIGGLAPLKTEDGRWGVIDTEGNIVLPFTYDAISQVSSGLIACWREENGWSILKIME